MSHFEYTCPVCGEFRFNDRHKCSPLYYCQRKDYWDDDPDLLSCSKIHASTPQLAAERYAENLAYSGALPSGNWIEIVVIDLEELIIFEVEVAQVAQASAEQKSKMSYTLPADEAEAGKKR